MQVNIRKQQYDLRAEGDAGYFVWLTIDGRDFHGQWCRSLAHALDWSNIARQRFAA